MAPGGLQMRVVRLGNGYSVSCTDEDKVSGHRPSVDVLFTSVAANVKQRAIGVILTGMELPGCSGCEKPELTPLDRIGKPVLFMGCRWRPIRLALCVSRPH